MAPPVIKSNLLEAAAENDRLWFENNVGRNYRIRMPIGGEREFLPEKDPGNSWIMIVRQIRPGVRFKVVLEVTGSLPLNSESVAVELFKLCRRATAEVSLVERHLQKEA